MSRSFLYLRDLTAVIHLQPRSEGAAQTNSGWDQILDEIVSSWPLTKVTYLAIDGYPVNLILVIGPISCRTHIRNDHSSDHGARISACPSSGTKSSSSCADTLWDARSLSNNMNWVEGKSIPLLHPGVFILGCLRTSASPHVFLLLYSSSTHRTLVQVT